MEKTSRGWGLLALLSAKECDPPPRRDKMDQAVMQPQGSRSNMRKCRGTELSDWLYCYDVDSRTQFFPHGDGVFPCDRGDGWMIDLKE